MPAKSGLAYIKSKAPKSTHAKRTKLRAKTKNKEQFRFFPPPPHLSPFFARLFVPSPRLEKERKRLRWLKVNHPFYFRSPPQLINIPEVFFKSPESSGSFET